MKSFWCLIGIHKMQETGLVRWGNPGKVCTRSYCDRYIKSDMEKREEAKVKADLIRNGRYCTSGNQVSLVNQEPE